MGNSLSELSSTINDQAAFASAIKNVINTLEDNFLDPNTDENDESEDDDDNSENESESENQQSTLGEKSSENSGDDGEETEFGEIQKESKIFNESLVWDTLS